MKRFLCCVLLALVTCGAALRAQDSNPALDHLSDLSRHGQLTELIRTGTSLLADGRLTSADQGIVLTYIGHACQQTGDFRRAAESYEKALATINRDGRHATNYATVLGSLASLYGESGQLDAAKQVLLRSIHLLEEQGAHAELAMMWNNLATLAADEHSRRDAHKFMAHSLAEADLVHGIDPDELAALTTTEARIAELDRDPATAVQQYQHALALWSQAHGAQDTRAAWLYVLLGGAYLETGDVANARESTLHGMRVLESSSGPLSPRNLEAELAYSKVLDASGATGEATTLRKEAQAALNSNSSHTQDEISIAALR